jgi:3-oxoacyl-[acyl-carrier-protein] synthase II
MTKKRVVITGIGMISPLGNTLKEAWDNCVAGKSGISKITRFDASAFGSQIAGEVKGFNPEAYGIDAKEQKKMDYFSMYALAAAKNAWEDSGVAFAGYDLGRAGCLLGVGMGGLCYLEKTHTTYMESGPRRITPFLIPAMISNLAPGHIGIKYGLRGVNFTITSACTSSTHALGEAYKLIASGAQDFMVTGGSESTVSPMAIGGFASMKALSSRNEEPEKASRPFDKDRDGFVLSEGAVVFILEELEKAKSRGAKIYAEVVGYGSSCDANHITAPCADGAGAIACMSMALADAKLNPEQITYVNSHGTSTPVGDIAETMAIKKLFGDYAKKGLMVISTKSVTGHLLGAAGAIEAAFSALSIKDDVIPPTMNLDNPDEQCDLDYVPHNARKTKVQYVMSNSFGFGGTNGTVILGKVS